MVARSSIAASRGHACGNRSCEGGKGFAVEVAGKSGLMVTRSLDDRVEQVDEKILLCISKPLTHSGEDPKSRMDLYG